MHKMANLRTRLRLRLLLAARGGAPCAPGVPGTRARRELHHGLLAAVVWALAQPVAQPAPLPAGAGACAGPQDDRLLAFQLYDTQSARALVESATEHMQAERWSEALVDLQKLLEEHRGELLGAERPRLRGRESVQDVHQGAASWAANQLAHLAPEAHDLYQKRHGDRAGRALAAAVTAGDRAALSAVARRWPITLEAVRAWWALGDLEFELGNIEAGMAAWARAVSARLGGTPPSTTSAPEWRTALSRMQERDLEEASSFGMRLEFALQWLEGADDELGGVTLPASGSALDGSGDYGRLGRAQDSWARPHDLSKDLWEHPFKRIEAKYSVYPTRLGDTLFYSTSRSLQAVDAYTGEVLWRTPHNMLGWRDMLSSRIRAYEKGVDLKGSLVRPSASQGVVVTHLQIPLTFEDQDDYGDLQIIRIIPERRLFAFDAETGARLWDTLPPPFWDGEGGSFADRMTVVGSPIIARTRVLVPTARLRGRVEFHIGCFDLHTGELLWNAPLLTGQRPLNMFGRLVTEYVAPPVRVVGDKVVVATQLGTVACLDLFTGETLWQTLYEQIPIRPGTYYEDGNLASVWRNAPPVVADGVVVVAPFDGYDLIGIDLETGTGLWNLSNAELNKRVGGNTRRSVVVNVLLDADQRRVYLAGPKVVAFEAPGGLRHEAPLNRAWVFPARGTTTDMLLIRLPRPVISNDRVYVPARGELNVLDRRDGRRVASMRWDSPGNLLLGEGMLFTLTSYTLNGFFEWETMVRRARVRLATNPGSPRAINTLALLLYKRGLSAMADGDYREATRWLANARGELEGLVDNSTEPDASLRQSLHGILRAEGRNMRLGADARGALKMLRRARELAPTPEHLRDTLLEEQEILRDRDPNGWLQVMTELDQQFGEMSLDVLVERSQADAQGWSGHLVPRAASLAGEDPSHQDGALPLGLWVLIERSKFWPERHRQDDARRQYADLHQILNTYADTPLFDGAAFDWAADHIGERLAGGDRRGYESFEARAQELLALAQSERDLELLETIPLLYPHSHAADASNDARIELSLLEGDAERVAEIVLGKGLPESWHPSEATQREVRHLLSLARALGEKGNLEFRAGLSASLARYHPDLRADPEGNPGVRLAELARSWATSAPQAAPTPTFDATITADKSVSSINPFAPVGVIPPGPGQTGQALMLCDDSRLYVYSTQSGPDTSWRYFFDNPSNTRNTRRGDPLPTDYENCFATSPGRVHVCTVSRVLTLDRDSDEELWSWSSGERRLVAVDQSGGVVVVREKFDRKGMLSLTGLDAASGVFLWRRDYESNDFHSVPIVGPASIVLLPSSSGTARVLDLYTGRDSTSLELGYSSRNTARSAWIEDDRLILPNFVVGSREEHNHVQAFDLNTGLRAWRVPLSSGSDGARELSEVFTWEDRHYLCLQPLGTGRDRRSPGLYELNTRLGALATQPVAELREDSDWIGVGRHRRTVLTSPYLFVLQRSDREDNRYLVRAIHVRFGQRWRSPLPPAFVRMPGSMPIPSVSDTTVALAYKLPADRPGSGKRRTRLLFLDRTSGRQLGSKELPESMWTTAAGVRFSPLGSALIVSGAKLMEYMR